VSAEDVIEVRVRRIAGAGDLPLPARATAGAAGVDLRARVDGAIEIAPGERALVPTGIAIALPEGYEGQVRPRSGLASEHGLTLLNAPGTVDADYRGEIKVIVINLGSRPARVERGDRIAQLVVQRLPQATWVEVEELPASVRGARGFGHSGRE
jgi:dUTP diphosphatase